MNFQSVFSAAAIEGMIRGPMAWAAFLICGLGIAFQCRRLMRMTQKLEMARPVFEGPRDAQPFPERIKGWLVFLRVSIAGITPCMTVISFVFHVCLLATPLLVMAHNVLLDTAFGFSFVSLPERTTDLLTVIVIFCGGFFLLRRIFVRRVRAISGPSDFILLAAAEGPFLTGFLAYHHVFDYQMMITLHILSAEILLVMIPFSRFSHMIFFFVSRLLIVGEHGRKSARRVWRYENTGSR